MRNYRGFQHIFRKRYHVSQVIEEREDSHRGGRGEAGETRRQAQERRWEGAGNNVLIWLNIRRLERKRYMTEKVGWGQITKMSIADWKRSGEFK